MQKFLDAPPCVQAGPVARGWRASAASMEIDVASLGTETPWQAPGEPAPLLRTGLPENLGTIEPLGTEHEIAFSDLLLGLDEASRISRFACVLSDDGIVRHA